jgi:Haem-NO-binding
MKGIVFTEFLEMVEAKFGYETVDTILSMKPLPSEGVYSSVGTYSHTEMVTLVVNLHEETKVPPTILLETFGEYLFGSLFKAYGTMFSGLTNAFDMLSSIEKYIHVEVKKLYPDAELPTFIIEEHTPVKLVMLYQSERRMADLAVGLIRGCLKQFGEEATIQQESITENGDQVRFIILK